MSETRTITVGMGVGDALARANKVADALRADGKVVAVGEEYDNVTARYYGLRSVDIAIDDPPAEVAQPSSAPETATTAEAAAAVVVAGPTPSTDSLTVNEQSPDEHAAVAADDQPAAPPKAAGITPKDIPWTRRPVSADGLVMTDAELSAQMAKDEASFADIDEDGEGDAPVTNETAAPAAISSEGETSAVSPFDPPGSGSAQTP